MRRLSLRPCPRPARRGCSAAHQRCVGAGSGGSGSPCQPGVEQRAAVAAPAPPATAVRAAARACRAALRAAARPARPPVRPRARARTGCSRCGTIQLSCDSHQPASRCGPAAGRAAAGRGLRGAHEQQLLETERRDAAFVERGQPAHQRLRQQRRRMRHHHQQPAHAAGAQLRCASSAQLRRAAVARRPRRGRCCGARARRR